MIIFLKGTTSSGKTTLANTIAELSNAPFLIIGIDTYMSMMPPKYYDRGSQAHEGFPFLYEEKDGEPLVRIGSGPFGRKLANSAHKIIKALVDDGHNLIIDEVAMRPMYLSQYAKALTEQKVYFIGVKCPLDIAKKREINRGDRPVGMVCWQYNRVHSHGYDYDLEVHSDQASPEEMANTILKFIKNNPNPTAFQAIPTDITED